MSAKCEKFARFFLIWESIFNWIHQWTINVDHPILDARVKIILQSFILKRVRRTMFHLLWVSSENLLQDFQPFDSK